MLNQNPPKVALWLLERILPSRFSAELSGDLQQVYAEKLASHTHIKDANLWFWQQTLLALAYHGMNRQRMLFLSLALVSIAIFALLLLSVLFLSCADSGQGVDTLMARDYWLNGAIHQIFLDPVYWQAMASARDQYYFDPRMFFNLPAFYWACSWLTVIYLLDKHYRLNAVQFAGLSLVALFGLYAWGAISIAADAHMQLQTVGPVIAYMWLSVMYLILPLGMSISRRFRALAQ